MIKYFTVENFYSIGNESVLEFDLHIKKDAAFLAHPTIGFAGSNASGKSNVLKALSFVLWFAGESFLEIKPSVENLFDENNKDTITIETFIANQEQPCKFHIIFTKGGIDYEYLLTVNTEKVFEEEFYYYPKKRQKLIYHRKELNVKFGDGISKFDAKDLRENCSIISLAAQFESQVYAQKAKEYASFSTNIRLGQHFAEMKFSNYLMLQLEKNDIVKLKTRELLKIADIGIEDFYTIKTNGILITIFKHKINGNLLELTSNQQSAGTLRILTLFFYVLKSLENGSLLILDEIELELHQNLVAYLLSLFQNPEINTKSAQLIFSFHNTSLMDILKTEQLWFVNKDENEYSEFYCAANVQGIKNLHNKSLETLYRIGRFGATPKLL
jgi:AAA15 family ATPase/GTPase